MKRHLFVCTNPRSSGKPACGNAGAALVREVQTLLIARGTPDALDFVSPLVTPCGCLGPCFDGPNAVVYPDGTWYAHLDAADAAMLVDHLIDGTVGAKRADPPGAGE